MQTELANNIHLNEVPCLQLELRNQRTETTNTKNNQKRTDCIEIKQLTQNNKDLSTFNMQWDRKLRARVRKPPTSMQLQRTHMANFINVNPPAAQHGLP